ncbi:MAG: penicillin-binding protein 2 [Alphaproteobacteria bacterium]
MNAAFSFLPKKSVQKRKVKVRAEQGFVATAKPVPAKTGCANLRFRAFLLAFVLCGGFLTLVVEIGNIALTPAAEPQASIRSLPQVAARRGNIYDTNGLLLAATLEVPSVFADPQNILNVTDTVKKLATVLPALNQKKLAKQLKHPKRRFVWVQRQVTPEQAFQINQLGLPGVSFRTEHVRVYPNRRMAAHVLGALDIDGRGVSGVEGAFHERLSSGQDVHVTIDSRLQEQLTRSITEAMDKSKAKGAWGVVLDAQTGDIRAMAALPDFDPNRPGESIEGHFNPITYGRYEMGSTMKLLTIAQGLQERLITPNSKIDCRFPITIGKYTIKDYHAKKAVLTATEVLRYSSNVGAAQIADSIGAARQKSFFKQLGLLDSLNIGLAEKVTPAYPPNWGRVHTFTISFGHGISITPMHLAAAVGAMSTDGNYRMPRLVEHLPHDAPRPVISPDILPQVKDMMRDTVVNGSGKPASLVGYDIGGKTGTAEKISGRGYAQDKNLVSFVGAVPMDKPKFVILVMVDEPIKGFETGGRIAAPAFGDFLKRSMPMLAIAPSAAAEEIKLNIQKAAQGAGAATRTPAKRVTLTTNGGEKTNGNIIRMAGARPL